MDNTKVKVLVVEDVKVAQIAAKLTLERGERVTVDVAENGNQAITLASKIGYNLILMDIGLPDMDGFQVTEKIRSMDCCCQDALIIALTAHDENDYKEKARAAGMNDFMEKPLTEEKIRALFNQFF